MGYTAAEQDKLVVNTLTNTDISDQVAVYDCKKTLKHSGIKRGVIINRNRQEKIFCDTNSKVYDFDKYIKIVHGNASEIYPKAMFEYDDGSQNIVDYFHRVSEILAVIDKNKKGLLLKQNFAQTTVHPDSAAAMYLQGNNKYTDIVLKNLIFPVKTNASQIQAVRMTAQNRISVIDGFAGTGKTQSIGNIIANIVREGKTAAVVAYNDQTARNICNKLCMIRSLEQVCIFFSKITYDEKLTDDVSIHPKIIFTGEQYINTELQNKINKLLDDLDILYQKKNEVQQLKQLKLDNEQNDTDELDNQICDIENQLMGCNFQEKENLLQQYSQEMLFEHIEHSYVKSEYVKSSFDTIQEAASCYPVVIMSADTLVKEYNDKEKNFLFDYVIVDDASMIDILSGTCCLAYARNAVVIGDSKQIGKIYKQADKKYEILQAIKSEYDIDLVYDYLSQNLLTSVLSATAGVEKIVLREHYRCHPRIISFCNQQFYNNQMVIMTEDQGEKDVLVILKTVPGNHARELDDKRFNVRQGEECQKLKDMLCNIYCYNEDDILCVVPYFGQLDIDDAAKVPADIPGTEKKVIIFETVDNAISDWVSDPRIVNTVLSHALQKVFIIISDNEKNHDSVIGNLIEYTEICDGLIANGKITSIFDYIYKSKRKNDAEGYMYDLLQTIIQQREFSFLRIEDHVPLKILLDGNPFFDTLTDEEKSYALCDKTHIDFVLYSNDNRPVLCIEVDGYKYHYQDMDTEVRDRKKNSILEKCSLELERFCTIGNDERNRIEEKLQDIFDADEQVSTYVSGQYLSYIREILVNAAKAGTLCCMPDEDGVVDTVPAINPTKKIQDKYTFWGINQILAKQFAKENHFKCAKFVTKRWVKANGYKLFNGVKIFPFLPVQKKTNELYAAQYVHISQIENGEEIDIKFYFQDEKDEKKQEHGGDLALYGYQKPKSIKNTMQEIICESVSPEDYIGHYLAAVRTGSKFVVTSEQAQSFAQNFIESIYEKDKDNHTDISKILLISQKANYVCKQTMKEKNLVDTKIL